MPLAILCLSALLGAMTLAWMREHQRRRTLAARYAGIADLDGEARRTREELARQQRDAADAVELERRRAERELARAGAELAQQQEQATCALAGERQRLTDEIAELQRHHAVFAEMHAARTSLLEAQYRARCSLHERLQRRVVLLQDTIEDLSQIKAQLAGEGLAEGSGPMLHATAEPSPWIAARRPPAAAERDLDDADPGRWPRRPVGLDDLPPD